jgi:peptide/nickel transport system ATP-binding protein
MTRLGTQGLVVRNLSVAYGDVRAVDDVSFTVHPGEILGLVGESGSGKSTAVLGALRLLPPPGRIVSGAVHLDGIPLFDQDAAGMRGVWGARVGLVPQGALSALNPVATLLEHISETLRAHGVHLDRAALRTRGEGLLARVGLDPVHLDAFPHTLSGGMRQRATLALALALDPAMLVLDEPTTALDVVVEREILRQLLAVQAESGFGMVFVTHDLALLLELATHVGVMYAGRLVEHGPVAAFHGGGWHPYTRGLIAALPPAPGEDRLPISIPGHAASVAAPPSGCRFHPRCALATPRCAVDVPKLDARRAPGEGEGPPSRREGSVASQGESSVPPWLATPLDLREGGPTPGHRVACHEVR